MLQCTCKFHEVRPISQSKINIIQKVVITVVLSISTESFLLCDQGSEASQLLDKKASTVIKHGSLHPSDGSIIDQLFSRLQGPKIS